MGISAALIANWKFLFSHYCWLKFVNRDLVINFRNKSSEIWNKFSSGLILSLWFIAFWIPGFWLELLRIFYFNGERFEKQLQVCIPQTLQGQGKKPGGWPAGDVLGSAICQEGEPQCRSCGPWGASPSDAPWMESRAQRTFSGIFIATS